MPRARSDRSAPATDTEVLLLRSKLGLCLRRGTASGLRVVITAPRDERLFPPDLGEISTRRPGPDAHLAWAADHCVLLPKARLPDQRVTWHVLIVDRDDYIVGSASIRFFSDSLTMRHVDTVALAEASGPILREQCELAVKETYDSARGAGRAFGEVSHWAVAPGGHERLASVMLVRAVAAFVTAFGDPLCLFSAYQGRNDIPILFRRGAAPFGRIGKSGLPPFIDRDTSSWRRIVLVDANQFHAYSRSNPAVELGVLRRHVAIVPTS